MKISLYLYCGLFRCKTLDIHLCEDGMVRLEVVGFDLDYFIVQVDCLDLK